MLLCLLSFQEETFAGFYILYDEFIINVSYFSLHNLKEINKNMFSGICQLARIFFFSFLVYSTIHELLHFQVITAGPDENPKSILSNQTGVFPKHVIYGSEAQWNFQGH